jgi:rhodanese-related sulfurtransferase
MVKAETTQFRKTLWQIPALIALAAIIGISTNTWRNDGISLVGGWAVEARFSDTAGESLAISLEQAVEWFEKDSVLFLDARPQSQYLEGHIRGALNLPWQEVDQYFMELADRLSDSEMIITYCDGESCDLSHELALFLKEMDYDNVRLLVNGWTVWQHADLPKE